MISSWVSIRWRGRDAALAEDITELRRHDAAGEFVSPSFAGFAWTCCTLAYTSQRAQELVLLGFLCQRSR